MHLRLLLALVVVSFLIAPVVHAQSDGTMPSNDPSALQGSATGEPSMTGGTDPVPSEQAPKDPIEPVPASTSASSTAQAGAPSAPASPSAPPAVAPAAVAPSTPPTAESASSAPAVIEAASSTQSEGSMSSNWLLWIVVVCAGLLPFGFIAAKSLRRKSAGSEPQEGGSQCFDLKQMMEEKLQELTDVRSQIESKIKSAAKSQLRDAVTGTATGDLITRADALEAEYNRIKKLFEKCMWDCGATTLRGSIVESSLVDTEALKKVKIISSRLAGEWTLHDVEVASNQLPELAKHIADGPWYMHFWESGKDDVKVVFKDRTFDIKHSDRTTWTDAVAYGTSLGIPEDKLDFPVGDH